MSLPQFANLRGPIARGTLRTTLVLGLRLVVQAGTLLLVARMLGPDRFGAFAGVVALAAILGTIAGFGTDLVLLGEVSKDRVRRRSVLVWALPLVLSCGTVLLIVYLIVCSLAFAELRISLPAVVALGFAEMELRPLFGLCVAEHHGLGRVARSQLLQTLPLALRCVAAAVVWLLHVQDPLATYAFGYGAAALLALVAGVATLPIAWPAIQAWHLPARRDLNNAIGYAALSFTATGPAELDKTLATKLLPTATAGLYAAGARVIGAATLPVVAMILSALPRLFREGQDQSYRTARLLRWIFATALVYSVVLAAGVWFVAPAIAWIFGPKYEGLQNMIHWLTLAVPAMTIRMAAGSVLMALGKPWMRVGFEAVGLGTLLACAVVLVPRLGALAMPLALANSEWIMAVVGVVLIARTRKNHGSHTPVTT